MCVMMAYFCWLCSSVWGVSAGILLSHSTTIPSFHMVICGASHMQLCLHEAVSVFTYFYWLMLLFLVQSVETNICRWHIEGRPTDTHSILRYYDGKKPS